MRERGRKQGAVRWWFCEAWGGTKESAPQLMNSGSRSLRQHLATAQLRHATLPSWLTEGLKPTSQ